MSGARAWTARFKAAAQWSWTDYTSLLCISCLAHHWCDWTTPTVSMLDFYFKISPTWWSAAAFDIETYRKDHNTRHKEAFVASDLNLIFAEDIITIANNHLKQGTRMTLIQGMFIHSHVHPLQSLICLSFIYVNLLLSQLPSSSSHIDIVKVLASLLRLSKYCFLLEMQKQRTQNSMRVILCTLIALQFLRNLQDISLGYIYIQYSLHIFFDSEPACRGLYLPNWAHRLLQLFQELECHNRNHRHTCVRTNPVFAL